MAYIYIDGFESALEYAIDDVDPEITLPLDAAARVTAAMGLGQYVPAQIAGTHFVRVPLFVSDGTQRELVFATHESMPGRLAIVRTAGLSFGAGAVVRCAPPAETVAAGHMMTRIGSGSDVIAAPGERGVLVTESAQINVKVASAGMTFRGDDWPAEVVIQPQGVTGARNLQFVRYDNNYGWVGPMAFSLSGAAARQTVLVIPDGCKMAVLTVRRPPVSARFFSLDLMVTAEFFV